MKKALFLVTMILFVLALIISQVIYAKEGVDKGPLTKRVFIHYKDPKPVSGKPIHPPKGSEGGYTYLEKGMRWMTPKEFYFNPSTTPVSTKEEIIIPAITKAMDTWEAAAGVDIFGKLKSSGYSVDTDKPDGLNVIVFDLVEGGDILAVSYVWGYFNCSPKLREIVEVDMIFNEYYWPWGDGPVSPEDVTQLDIQNIATHEFGHAAGMGDLYDISAEEETMYWASGYGETKKRDLDLGDIAGITNLYK